MPEFLPIYQEHLAYNDGLLPHVLMGDFTRFIFDAYRRAGTEGADPQGSHDLIMRGLGVMEAAIASPDARLQNLVSVSFVENMLPSDASDIQVYSALKQLLGPMLREELQHYEPGTDPHHG